MRLQLLTLFLFVGVCHVMSQVAQRRQRDPNSLFNQNILRYIMMNRQLQQQQQQQPSGQMPVQGQVRRQVVPIYVPVATQPKQMNGFGSLFTGALVAQHDPFEDFFSSMF